MGIWDKHIESYFNTYGEKWFAKGEDIIEPFISLLDRAHKNVKIFASDLTSHLFYDKKVTNTIQNLVKHRVNVEAITCPDMINSPIYFAIIDNSHILLGNIKSSSLIKYKTLLLAERQNYRFEEIKKRGAEEIKFYSKLAD